MSAKGKRRLIQKKAAREINRPATVATFRLSIKRMGIGLERSMAKFLRLFVHKTNPVAIITLAVNPMRK